LLVVDKYGFFYIYVGPFIPNGSIGNEPLIFSKDYDQIFLVDHIINSKWKLFVKVNPCRSAPITATKQENTIEAKMKNIMFNLHQYLSG
jgi:hypothetical protein